MANVDSLRSNLRENINEHYILKGVANIDSLRCNLREDFKEHCILKGVANVDSLQSILRENITEHDILKDAIDVDRLHGELGQILLRITSSRECLRMQSFFMPTTKTNLTNLSFRWAHVSEDIFPTLSLI